jgi:hypothetical protein
MEGDLFKQTSTLGITRVKKLGYAVASNIGGLALYNAQGGTLCRHLLVTKVWPHPDKVHQRYLFMSARALSPFPSEFYSMYFRPNVSVTWPPKC